MSIIPAAIRVHDFEVAVELCWLCLRRIRHAMMFRPPWRLGFIQKRRRKMTSEIQRRAYLCLLTIVLGCVLALAQTPPQARTKIMVVATYHFTSKNDLYNLKQDDPLSPKRQKEIAEAVERLAAFRPTKIALEWDASADADYAKYLRSEAPASANERDQIGFRLAKQLNLKHVYGIDYKNDWPFEGIPEFAEKNGQSELLARCMKAGERFTHEMDQLLQKGTVLDALRYINSPAALADRQSIEMLLARIGKDNHYPGVKLESSWYERNLRIFANLSRIVESGDDRILVLYGQGHIPVLRQFVADSPDYELVDPAQYLGMSTPR